MEPQDTLTPQVDDGTVSIAPPPPVAETPQTVSIWTNDRPYQVAVPEHLAKIRAFKAAYGLKDVNPHPEQEIQNQMIAGYEDIFRQQVASELDQKNAKEQSDLMTNIATKRPELLNSDEFTGALARFNKPATNPNTVFEQAFAKTLMNDSLDPTKSRFIANTQMTLGDAFDSMKVVGGDMITKQQVLRRLAQDIATKDVANQSYLGWGADVAKTFLQSYVEWKKRGNVPGVSFFDGPLGLNLQKQAQKLFSLPSDQFESTVKKIVEPLRKDNPRLAAEWLMELAGQTSEEKFVNDMLTFMMPINTAGLIYGAKTIGKAPPAIFDIEKRKTAVGTKISNIETVTKNPIEAERPTPEVQKKLDAELKGLYAEQDKLDKHLAAYRGQKAVSDIVVGNSSEPITPASMAAAAGDLEKSAVKQVAETTDNLLSGKPEEAKDIAKSMMTYLNADKNDIAAKVPVGGQELANRLYQAYDKMISQIEKGLLNRKKIDKAPGVFESEELVEKLKDGIKNSGQFDGLEHSIIDIQFRPHPVLNGRIADIYLGDVHGALFDSPAAAKNWMEFRGLSQTKAAEVVADEQQGGFFKIRISQPVRETEPLYRSLLVPTEDQVQPTGLLRSWIGWAVNPDETMSLSERENRKLATYGPQWLMELGEHAAKTLQSFARGATVIDPLTGKTEKRQLGGMRKRWFEWETMVKAGKTMPDPDRPGEFGYFFKSIDEINLFYNNNFGRAPMDAEVQAYFAYKQITEYDRILRDLALVTGQWRRGVEEHTFSLPGMGTANVQGPTFKGTREFRLPSGEGTILLAHEKLETVDVRKLSQLGGMAKKIREGLSEGKYNLVRVDNPQNEMRTFQGFGGIHESKSRIQYVLTSNLDTKPISFNQLPRRGGGHWDVDHPFYIKQAKMFLENFGNPDSPVKRWWYHGDTTIMPISIRKKGEEVATHLDEIRKFLANDQADSAEFYARKHLPDIPWEDIDGWFKPKKIDGETRPAYLSLHEPIKVVEKNKQIVDQSKELEYRYGGEKSFTDGTKQGNPAMQSQIEFTGLRDGRELHTVNNVGTSYNPLYKYTAAEMVNPIETMNRALTRIVQSTYMEDYKMFAVENWLKQAKQYLNPTDKDLYSTPLHWFNKPEWKNGVDEGIKRNLMNTNWQIRQLLGVSNPIDNMLRNTMQTLVDNIYGKFGEKATKLVPNFMINGVAEPVSFIKQVTYHMSLGLFSIPQLFVQAQTYALIAALAPKSVASGTYMAMLHQWSRLNPGMVETLDRYATKLRIPGLHGVKPGVFTEARKFGLETGFFSIQGEHAFLADAMAGNKIIKNGFDQVLDWGLLPFKGAERQVRLGAWYTAFTEFRVANPLGRITDKEVGKILNRADDLYANMSKASSSSLHSGVLGVTSQFLSYQLRLGELFLGSRTTAADKLRMFGVFSALYGVPMATGLTALPLGDMLRQKAMEHDYVVGENWYTTAINEGLPSLIAGLATGNYYNIGERYGAGGMEFLRDFMRSDKSMFQILGGAAWSKVTGIFEAADPFWFFMMSAIRQDGPFTLKAEHFVQPLREVSSFNNGMRLLDALNTQRWLSKKGIYLDDTSPLNAVFMSVTGLQKQSSADLQTLSASAKDRDALAKWAEKNFDIDFKKGLRIAATDPEGAQEFYNNAMLYLIRGGIRDDEFSKILARASKDNESLVKQIDYSYYIRKAPQDKIDSHREAFSTKKVMEQ